jgi:hypothetical protein
MYTCEQYIWVVKVIHIHPYQRNNFDLDDQDLMLATELFCNEQLKLTNQKDAVRLHVFKF